MNTFLQIMTLETVITFLVGIACSFVPAISKAVFEAISPDTKKAVRVVLKALGAAQAEWPEKFNDPNVTWDDYVTEIATKVLANEPLQVDTDVVVKEVIKLFKPLIKA